MVGRRTGGMARGLAVGAVVALVVAACGGSDDDTAAAAGTGGSAAGGPVTGEVRVLAAASLTDVFEDIATVFVEQNPDAEVTFSFAGSSALVTQVVEGAPADVLATASAGTMDDAVAADAVQGDPAVFARNALVLVVPAGNPGDVTELADLADTERFVGLCAEDVPCGALATEVLSDEDVTPRVDTYEPDVRSLLTKVTSGELDAGLVYRTDALAAGDDVEIVEVPALDDHVTAYPIAPLADAPNPEAAERFVELVLGGEGLAILGDAGFLPPDGG